MMNLKVFSLKSCLGQCFSWSTWAGMNPFALAVSRSGVFDRVVFFALLLSVTLDTRDRPYQRLEILPRTHWHMIATMLLKYFKGMDDQVSLSLSLFLSLSLSLSLSPTSLSRVHEFWQHLRAILCDIHVRMNLT